MHFNNHKRHIYKAKYNLYIEFFPPRNSANPIEPVYIIGANSHLLLYVHHYQMHISGSVFVNFDKRVRLRPSPENKSFSPVGILQIPLNLCAAVVPGVICYYIATITK
jgi:hypothetical protein